MDLTPDVDCARSTGEFSSGFSYHLSGQWITCAGGRTRSIREGHVFTEALRLQLCCCSRLCRRALSQCSHPFSPVLRACDTCQASVLSSSPHLSAVCSWGMFLACLFSAPHLEGQGFPGCQLTWGSREWSLGLRYPQIPVHMEGEKMGGVPCPNLFPTFPYHPSLITHTHLFPCP